MKIIDIPQSGKLGTFVSYRTRYGQFRRPYIVPFDPHTETQMARRARMAKIAARWRTLTDLQRAAWNAAASERHTNSHLGRSGRLLGYNLFVSINCNLADIGQSLVVDPPDHPQFSDNPVAELIITNTGGIIPIQLSVPSAPVAATLVFATRPGSAGASYPGRFVFIGLLPIPSQGVSDITEMYVRRYGVPPPTTRIFVQTQQQVNGWKDDPKRMTVVVPAA